MTDDEYEHELKSHAAARLQYLMNANTTSVEEVSERSGLSPWLITGMLEGTYDYKVSEYVDFVGALNG